MSTPTEQELVEREVLAELEAGNWPACFACHRVDQVGYIGMIQGSPNFMCGRCSAFFGLDLIDADEDQP